MTRKETLSRACLLDHPPVAYLITIGHQGGLAEYEITWDDLARDAAWFQARLEALGLERGHRALVTFAGHEGLWFQPVIEALRNLGVVYGTAEAMGWDHLRTRVFHRELDLHAVIGLSLETLEALSGQVMIEDLFRDTPVVLARPEGAARLREVAVPAVVISPLGPALAVGCGKAPGAHVNAAEWKVAERDGRLAVAASEKRASGQNEIVLDVAGSVVTGRCACGSDDPRVIFS